MSNPKATHNIIYCIVGIVLITAAIVLAISYTVPQGVMLALPFVMGGIGLIQLFAGVNGAVLRRALNKDAKFAKQVSDYDDERSSEINLKTKAKANELTTILLWALLLFLAVMDVQLVVLLVFLGAILLRIFVTFYYVRKYNKEM
jgi:hypothetical protein